MARVVFADKGLGGTMILNSGNIWSLIAGEQGEFVFMRDRGNEVRSGVYASMREAVAAYVHDEMEALGESKREAVALELMFRHIAGWQASRKSMQFKPMSDIDIESYLSD